MTMPTRAMIKNIFHFVLARLISSKTEGWYISCISIRAIVANSGLKVQGMEHIVHTPLARQLKTEGHGTNSSNDPKWPNKLSSKLLQQPRCQFEMLS